MWIIIKYKRSEYSLLLSQISKKIKDIKIYCPKLIYEKNNKFFTNYILEDYLFCFHENFNDKKIYSKLKYLKGLSSILDGCSLNQDQIIEFKVHNNKYRIMIHPQSYVHSIIKYKNGLILL